jgi:hypothetical protein
MSTQPYIINAANPTIAAAKTELATRLAEPVKTAPLGFVIAPVPVGLIGISPFGVGTT